MSVSKSTRELVRERDQFMCLRCGTYIGPFGIYSLHHRRPRGMGGTRRPESDLPGNLVLLCGSGTTGCHGEVESDRIQAGVDGFLVSQHTDPEAVAVRTWRGWARIYNDGALALMAQEEQA